MVDQKYQLMPRMTDEQFRQLKEDIRIRGVVVPLEFDEEGAVLDGHHRFDAYSELIEEGCDLPMYDKVVRKFSSEEEKIAYVIALNVKRRHLTAEQRQELVVKLRRAPYHYTQKYIAELLGVDKGTISRDIDALPDEVRDELKNLPIIAKDRVFDSANFAPKIYITGSAQLREMQMAAAAEIAKTLSSTNGYVAPTDAVYNVAAQPSATPTTPITDDEAHERILAFAWYGGKASHLNWLLPLLPHTRQFVDVFGGSGAVLMNKAPSPVETYNDLDGDLVNFFKVLRDDPENLIRLLLLTPYSREERRYAFTHKQEANTPLERARKFFVLARQTRSGLAQKEKGMLNSWKFDRDIISRGLSKAVAEWQSGIDGLAAVTARLRRVQIENYPYERVLELYDSPETLFYCDPPYVHTTRREGHWIEYTGEMSDEEHRLLAQRLHRVRGKVALSGYPSDLYDELYSDWHRFDMPVMSSAGSVTQSERIECLWTNYPLKEEANDARTEPVTEASRRDTSVSIGDVV